MILGTFSETNPNPFVGTYAADGDENGIVNFIGKNLSTIGTWTNPHTAGRVTVQRSSYFAQAAPGDGGPEILVDRGTATKYALTDNVDNSWIALDLGAGRTAVINKYSLRTRFNSGGRAMRNWKLQGSNNAASNSVADLAAATWTDLDSRVNDTTMPTTSNAWGTYTLGAVPSAYRWLRVLQNGANASGADLRLALQQFEFYGTLTVSPDNPASFSGLVAWFKASSIGGLADGDPVSTWSDLSGAGNHATGSGATRPLYKTGILNGKAVVRFDAVDDKLTTALTVADPYTILIVYSQSAGSGFHRILQGSNNWLMGGYSSVHALYNNNFINGPAVSVGVFVKSVALSGAGQAELRVNGASQGTNADTGAPGTLYLGAGGTSPGETPAGDIAEIAVYNRKLSSAEYLALESYFAGEWGV